MVQELVTLHFVMAHNRFASLRRLDLLATLALASLLVWTYLGFLQPDPYVLEKGGAIRFLRLAILITFPLAAVALLSLYVAVRTNRIAKGLVILAGAASALAFLIAFPIASYVYDASYAHQLDRFHPYLQLAPRSLILRSSANPPFKVFCLGGSTTDFLDPNGKGWPDRVEERLRGSYPGRDLQVYNLGRRWYTTQHTLINYMLNLRPFRPDVVIVMQSINDLLENADFSYMSRSRFRGDYRHFLGPETRLIHRKSFLGFTGEVLSGLWYHKPREEIFTEEFPGLASYRRNVEAIIELAKMDGARVVLMSEPSLFKEEMSQEEKSVLRMINYGAIGPEQWWSTETARVGMARYNATMRELAREHGLLFIDLDGAIPKTLEYFKDEVHYRLKAYDVVADFVAQQLATH